MEERVLNIVSSFVGTSADELKNKIDTEGVWDSLQKVEIVIAIEDEFDISFTQEEIAELKTINQINELIKGKM